MQELLKFGLFGAFHWQKGFSSSIGDHFRVASENRTPLFLFTSAASKSGTTKVLKEKDWKVNIAMGVCSSKDSTGEGPGAARRQGGREEDERGAERAKFVATTPTETKNLQLLEAAREGSVSKVEKLLDSGAEANAFYTVEDRSTPLREAVYSGSIVRLRPARSKAGCYLLFSLHAMLRGCRPGLSAAASCQRSSYRC